MPKNDARVARAQRHDLNVATGAATFSNYSCLFGDRERGSSKGAKSPKKAEELRESTFKSTGLCTLYSAGDGHYGQSVQGGVCKTVLDTRWVPNTLFGGADRAREGRGWRLTTS
jgi:hypothetical protein